MPAKRYRVSGCDDQGDLHSFETDEAARALVALAEFRAAFEEANLEDREQRD